MAVTRLIRRAMVTGSAIAALSVAAFTPALASAQNAVGGLLDDVGSTVNGVTGGGGGAGASVPDTRGGVPPNYQPPMHGSNPHGQGTVAVIDINPSDTAPLAGDPSNGDEEIVVGDSRGEQNGDTYHGRVTLLHINLGPINQGISIESNEGESNSGDTGALNAALSTLCTSGGQSATCLEVLSLNSSTSSSGSSNSFQAVGADLGIPDPLGGILPDLAGVVITGGSSSGNISDDGTCQTASGSSSVASADVAAGGQPAVDADLLSSSTTSTACNDGRQSQQNDSSLGTVNGNGIPECSGPNETPDHTVVDTAVLKVVCNADDTNGVGEAITQTSAPYGVREALTAFVIVPMVATIKLAISGPESHAVAPPAATTPGPSNPRGAGREGEAGPGGDDPEGEPAAGAGAQDAPDTLAFTGADMLMLGLIGAALILGGLMLAATGKRYRSTA